MTEITTLEQVPAAVSQALQRLSRIEQLLENREEPKPERDVWFDIKEFCAYHPDKPAIPTAYTWVAERKVPFHKGNTKKLRFLKSEIDAWLKQGRAKTSAEASAEADTYIKRRAAV